MGKYIRKAKTRGELAVMEVSQSSLGVRTRAKTLALQNSNSNSNSYLQLRSRRLQKPLPNVVVNGTHDSKRHKNSNATTAAAATTTANDNNSKEAHILNHDEIVGVEDTNQQEDNLINKTDFGVQEASFGENVLDFEARERSTRESTPCSLIRDPDNIRTPGSTTRPTCSTETNRRTQNATQRHIPTSHEIDEFFAGAEEEQQRQFVEKYNFDPVSDKPLPGRYEWEKLDP
ncbi:cyclin-dependent kinase inhibitor 4-like [Quercus lobata]|uniref:Cyclin-dependent kinase inhibitor domain-containing protein n=1 Tax=Quercus lobata TaxID=97700 RepID=A0A7N2LYY1_QUELO|nr:cyclin-dependent kinase inhibitor 4-like [Quercus lobata]